MTTPAGNSPEEPQSPSSEFQVALDQAVARYIRLEVLPAINALKTQTEAALRQGQDMEGRLAQRIPTVEQTVQQTVAVLRAESQAAHEQQRAELTLRAQAANNGNGRPEAIVPSSRGTNLQEALQMILATLPTVTKELVNTYAAIATLNLEREKVKLAQTNPIALARVMAEKDPLMARFIGMALSPDPWQQQIPGMMASATDATSRAVISGLLRSGWTPPGTLPPPPGGPPASLPAGSPAGPTSAPLVPINPQNPVNWPGPTPGPTGGNSGVPSATPRGPSNPNSAVMLNANRSRWRLLAAG